MCAFDFNIGGVGGRYARAVRQVVVLLLGGGLAGYVLGVLIN